MREFTRTQTIWGLGLSDAQAENIRSMAGRLYSLELWPAGAMPDFANAGNMAAPCMVCFTMDSCRRFMSLPARQTGFLELTPKVLLLDPDADMATIDEALTFGVSDIIRPPLAKKRFSACLRKAAEAAALQRDIQNMAHEVFIEREMLERKNEALSFLVNFLSRISEALDETELLGKAFTCLKQLFPVMTMHAAIFSKDDNNALSADLFIAAPADTPAYNAWRNSLLEIGNGMEHSGAVNPTTIHLPLSGEAASSARPGDGHILTLPVHIGDSSQLYLMLLTSMERNLSRDQALALDSALRHMASTIKNVRRYQEVCNFADRDSLTGAFNRRHFEQTLQAEIARHERYGDEISLLILDIDHFKNINDSFGHLKGDEVLRAVVGIITATVRQTDYCVRYGGEEFVVLLPHTSSSNAAWLAERLRKKIQKLSFRAGKNSFGVTASIGVATIPTGESKDGAALTSEADQALYLAKNGGRNKVMVFTTEGSMAASL
ncbi:putative Diguanylate cyclase domain protein [uncultured delta proteobacterium]|uniref:Putative Diguanylate cyclase domain protein n=1 Tax=uncultured delta proteobacterium TaxID=34034 RepID=A0A212ITC8_9DELT|nr:putative Diguanylate cyclase domain protein [uncultured delta proteobacterium]